MPGCPRLGNCTQVCRHLRHTAACCTLFACIHWHCVTPPTHLLLLPSHCCRFTEGICVCCAPKQHSLSVHTLVLPLPLSLPPLLLQVH